MTEENNNNEKLIWLIEDDMDILDVFDLVLEDYATTKISGRKELYTRLERHRNGEVNSPSLILLDASVNDINAEEICKLLTSNEQLASTPTILVSAAANIEELSKKLHVDDYLAKPFDIGDLLMVIQNNIE